MNVNTQRRDGNAQIDLDKLPDHCPVCWKGIQPVDSNQRFLNDGLCENVFRCPRQNCEHFFIGRYTVTRNSVGVLQGKLLECVPLTTQASRAAPEIQAISPDFAAVFREAEEAEQRGLKLVCGPGYRKALEFLIKDYVVKLHSEKAEQVKKLNLGACITEYVKNDRINTVASRAVWLGNDETHYLRKWDGKDLQDLKGLIALTVHWIEMEQLTEAVLRDMPAGK